MSGALVEVAGHLCSFLDAGGWIAWGAVPTDGPVGRSPDRYWRELSALWCALVLQGCDPAGCAPAPSSRPACGLALHDEDQAATVLRLTNEVARKVQEQDLTSRLTVGS